jgi:hypothetical protein
VVDINEDSVTDLNLSLETGKADLIALVQGSDSESATAVMGMEKIDKVAGP